MYFYVYTYKIICLIDFIGLLMFITRQECCFEML